MHSGTHHLAGATVKIKEGVTDPVQGAVVGGAEFRIEDWFDRVLGDSWQNAAGNFAAMHYAYRSAANGVSPDDEVLYGKIGLFGHGVHVSEIELP